jgi:hypothetical protein
MPEEHLKLKNLKAKITTSKIDPQNFFPFLKFSLGHQTQTTDISIMTQRNPKWEETIKFTLHGTESQLVIEVWNEDQRRGQVKVGEAHVDAGDLEYTGYGEKWVPIFKGSKGKTIGELFFEFSMGSQNILQGDLLFKPKSATLTVNMDNFTKQDPYLLITCGHQQEKTEVCSRGGKYPTWDDTFLFELNGHDECLEVECFDHDMVGKDDYIANTKIYFKDFLLGGQRGEKKVELERNGDYGGELVFEYEFKPKKKETAGLLKKISKKMDDVGSSQLHKKKTKFHMNEGKNNRRNRRPNPKHYSGVIVLRPNQGQFFEDHDTFGKMDPFVQMKVAAQIQKTKAHKSGGLHPKWNDYLTFYLKKDTTISIECRDQDIIGSDFIGKTELYFEDFLDPNRTGGTHQVELFNKQDQLTGIIEMDWEFVDQLAEKKKRKPDIAVNTRMEKKKSRRGRWLVISPRMIEFNSKMDLIMHFEPYLKISHGFEEFESKIVHERGIVLRMKDNLVFNLGHNKGEEWKVEAYSRNVFCDDDFIGEVVLKERELTRDPVGERWVSLKGLKKFSDCDLFLEWKTVDGEYPDESLVIERPPNVYEKRASKLSGGMELKNRFGTSYIQDDRKDRSYGYKSYLY